MKKAVLIPALAPDKSFPGYVRELAALGLGEVVVVDDGSGPEYAEIFSEIAAMEGCTVLTHAQNRGKGAALKTGFRHIAGLGADYAGVVSADADGQHSVADVARLAEALEDRPELLLGVRDFSQKDVPRKSRFGNNLTRRIFRLLYRVSISDTQTGLRGFPRCLFPMLLECGGDRYEFETEMLIQCAKRKIPIREIPIRTIYLNQNESSHFDPVRDSFRIYRLFFGTFVRYLLSSASAAVIDLLLFTLLIHTVFRVTTGYIFLATALARLASSAYNFLINRRLVFSSRGRVSREVLRYYALVAAQMFCSASLVALLTRLLPSIPTVNKLVVDTCLFFLSYHIQKKYIFRP